MESRSTVLVGRSAVAALVLLLAAARVEAAEKRFSVSPFATALSSGAFHSPLDGLHLGSSNNPYFAFAFIVPRDYVPNTDIRIRLYWTFVGALIFPCDFVLERRTRDRGRAGEYPHFDAAGEGMKPARRILSVGPIEPLGVAPFDLTPPANFGQKGGDSIVVAFQRTTSGGEDSCAGVASLVITGIELIYSAKS